MFSASDGNTVIRQSGNVSARSLHGTDKLQLSKGQREVDGEQLSARTALTFLLWREGQNRFGIANSNGAPKSKRPLAVMFQDPSKLHQIHQLDCITE